jgi:iron(III) transport system substrate-binding protein
VPEDVAKFFPAEHRDADGLFATARVYVSALGYNTNLVKKEDAPKSFRDLLDPNGRARSSRRIPATAARS